MQRSDKILPNFQEQSFVFPGNSKGTEKNKNNSKVFFKKVCPQPRCLSFFSGILHFKRIDLNWSYKTLAQKEVLTLCQERVFASFSCVLSFISVGFRKVHTSIYKLVLSDIKVKMSCLSPFVRLTPSVFSKSKVLRWYTYQTSFTDMGSVALQF